jgi:hypothetical protein
VLGAEPDTNLVHEQVRGDRKQLEELEALLLQKFARWEWFEERRARSL